MKKQLIRLISRLPFGVLYFLSDIIYDVIYYIVRYRLAVVRTNLRNAFPEKSQAELRKIEKGFYHFLCDYGVESLKLLTISAEEMKRHMVFENVDQVDRALDDHNFVFVYIGHYGNWEWMSSLPLWARKDATLGELYRPLKSKTMDDVFIDIRQHFNAECISKYEALRHIMRFNAEKRKCIIGFVADQTPHPDNTQLWMDFLSQDTPIFTGTERIGKKVNAAIYFAEEIARLTVGYLGVEAQIISDRAVRILRNVSKDHARLRYYFVLLVSVFCILARVY